MSGRKKSIKTLTSSKISSVKVDRRITEEEKKKFSIPSKSAKSSSDIDVFQIQNLINQIQRDIEGLGSNQGDIKWKQTVPNDRELARGLTDKDIKKHVDAKKVGKTEMVALFPMLPKIINITSVDIDQLLASGNLNQEIPKNIQGSQNIKRYKLRMFIEKVNNEEFEVKGLNVPTVTIFGQEWWNILSRLCTSFIYKKSDALFWVDYSKHLYEKTIPSKLPKYYNRTLDIAYYFLKNFDNENFKYYQANDKIKFEKSLRGKSTSNPFLPNNWPVPPENGKWDASKLGGPQKINIKINEEEANDVLKGWTDYTRSYNGNITVNPSTNVPEVRPPSGSKPSQWIPEKYQDVFFKNYPHMFDHYFINSDVFAYYSILLTNKIEEIPFDSDHLIISRKTGKSNSESYAVVTDSKGDQWAIKSNLMEIHENRNSGLDMPFYNSKYFLEFFHPDSREDIGNMFKFIMSLPIPITMNEAERKLYVYNFPTAEGTRQLMNVLTPLRFFRDSLIQNFKSEKTHKSEEKCEEAFIENFTLNYIRHSFQDDLLFLTNLEKEFLLRLWRTDDEGNVSKTPQCHHFAGYEKQTKLTVKPSDISIENQNLSQVFEQINRQLEESESEKERLEAMKNFS